MWVEKISKHHNNFEDEYAGKYGLILLSPVYDKHLFILGHGFKTKNVNNLCEVFTDIDVGNIDMKNTRSVLFKLHPDKIDTLGWCLIAIS
jgi:hypothetical protein